VNDETMIRWGHLSGHAGLPRQHGYVRGNKLTVTVRSLDCLHTISTKGFHRETEASWRSHERYVAELSAVCEQYALYFAIYMQSLEYRAASIGLLTYHLLIGT
jgi:hypothetical protein